MRFFNALIWLTIITVLFSGALYSVIYLDIPVGQGNPTENVSWYILTQDENNPLYTNDKLRFMYAEKFLSLGAAQLLIYLTVFWVGISLLWMVVGELLRIDRPNRSIRYIWLWFLFLIIILIGVAGMTYYFLYIQDEIWHIAEWSRMISLITFMLFYSGVFFYLVSVFITSRVLRSAVPFLTIILRN